MNCQEFKNKVIDLFDTTVEMHTQSECNAHMAECPECRAYYEELLEAFKTLHPQNTHAKLVVGKSVGKRRRLWRSIAAAAVFLLGFFVGWSHLFSNSVDAEPPRGVLFDRGISSIRNVGSVQMVVYARTTPNENFAHFDPKADFVRIDINRLCQNDSVFYRVEKQGGRTVVCDGKAQYLWVPDMLYLKLPVDANCLETYLNLLYPERLLVVQKSAVDFSKKNSVTRTETDSTIILTVVGTEKNRDLQQLLETGHMGDCTIEVENVFSKNDGLLRFVKLWVVSNSQKTLLMYIDDIRYNVMINRNALIQKPKAEWIENEVCVTSKDRLSELQVETPSQAAQRIMNALISGQTDDAKEALVYYQKFLPQLVQSLKGCTATDFTERREGGYAGVYVFYTLTRPDGTQKKRHVAVRNDNDQHIWILDGGL